MDVVVQPAPEDAKSTLRNLMQLYFYDMSEFKPRPVDGHGLFHYKYFDDYWSKSDRYPFLIRVDGLPAGFALVWVDQGTVDIAEFFVLRGHRRTGVGSVAARQLFDMFPGPWQLRQETNNFAAQTFWRAVLSEYTGGDFEDLTRDEGPIQRFESRVIRTPASRSLKEA